MIRWLASAFGAGLLFALGLGISGMTRPSKVIGFLDVTGDWDPSLGLVMAGAVGLNFVLLRLALRRRTSLFGGPLVLPATGRVDSKLIVGAALFGVGWGAGGFCPGPALAAIATGAPAALLFAGAMLAGVLLRRLTESSPAAEAAPIAPAVRARAVAGAGRGA